jgi:O-antigen ligase
MRARTVNEVVNWLVVVLAFSIPLYRAWVSLSTALILVLWFFQGDLGGRFARVRRHGLTLAIVAFMALNLLSLLWSSHPAEGIEYWFKYR